MDKYAKGTRGAWRRPHHQAADCRLALFPALGPLSGAALTHVAFLARLVAIFRCNTRTIAVRSSATCRCDAGAAAEKDARAGRNALPHGTSLQRLPKGALVVGDRHPGAQTRPDHGRDLCEPESLSSHLCAWHVSGAFFTCSTRIHKMFGVRFHILEHIFQLLRINMICHLLQRNQLRKQAYY